LHVLKRWAAWPRGIRWLAGIAGAVLVLAIVWVLFVPAADWLAHHDVGSAKRSLHETAVDNARGRLLTLGAGLLAAAALLFTALNLNLLRGASEKTDEWQRRNYEQTEQGQVTDRYTKAIEQLGSGTIDVTIGGIYALERIAHDSPRDHPTVMEVLSACIREHSREQWPKPDPDIRTRERSTRPDIQAALTVIGRRETEHDVQPIDLANADLTRAKLASAALGGADLTNAKLTDADLTGADLTQAKLTSADLSRAELADADLTGADLPRAKLVGADLTGADLTGAALFRADLTGVHGGLTPPWLLVGPDAKRARVNFTWARLQGANLTRANFWGADFSDAYLTNATLIEADLTNAKLTSADLSGADLSHAKLASADLTGATLRGTWWPTDTPIPEGWKLLGTSSGRLVAADTGPDPAEPN
jgi:uncharacterized protein YjbI with pentapeptide repeats